MHETNQILSFEDLNLGQGAWRWAFHSFREKALKFHEKVRLIAGF